MELTAEGVYDDLEITGADLGTADLHGTTFRHCRFDHVRFPGADLSEATLERCTFGNCDLSNVDFTDATLDTVAVRDSKVLGATFTSAILRSVFVTDTHCSLATFLAARIRDSSFLGCDLSETDFRDATIRHVALVRCDLSSVAFTGVDARQLDIRGSALNGSFNLTHCRGFVLGDEQLFPLVTTQLREIGATVDDQPLPDPPDLPGGHLVALLEPADLQVAQRGLRDARAKLRPASP
jgi:uncharacterized protein YjbI with pentapeptide repeats